MKNFKKLTAILLSGTLVFGILTALPLITSAAETSSAVQDGDVLTSSDGYYEYRILSDGTAEFAAPTYFYRFSHSYEIPSTIDGYVVTSIGDSAFFDERNLESVTIPDTVTSIGEFAFSHCISLASITIPDGVTYIGSSAFYECYDLTSITIPDGVTEIKEKTFYGCYSLTSVTIPDSVTSIGEEAFYCESGGGIDELYLGSGITTIGKDAFCGNLVKNVYFNGTLDDWCSIEFVNSSSNPLYGNLYLENELLTSVTISQNTAENCLYTFCGCESLEEVIILDGITSIGSYMFSSCSGLTSITIPDSVTSIGNSAFYGCDNLTVYGYSGSYAETYANNNGITFVSIGEVENTESTAATPTSSTKATEPTENTRATTPTSATKATEPTENTTDAATPATATEPVTYSEPTTLGDVNGDGSVTIADVTTIQKGIAQIITLTEAQQKAANVSGDDVVSITDATVIQKYIAQIITEFPADK